jgi:hypothetical protein
LWLLEKDEEGRATDGMDDATKQWPARARALPDEAVAFSACLYFNL